MGELKRGVNVLFGKMDDLADATNRKLDGLASALHEMRASRPTDWREMLTVVREGAMLFALVVAGILYLAAGSGAGGVKSGDLHAIDKRLQAVELRMQFAKGQ
jgi:hypothetical protein